MKRLRLRIDPSWSQHSYRTRVSFYHTDAMKIVWHGHYLKFLEDARADFFAAHGMSYQRLHNLGWGAPVVAMQLDWLKPAKHPNELEVLVACIPNDKCLVETISEIYRVDEQGEREDLLVRATCDQAIIDADEVMFMTRPPVIETFFASIEASRPRTCE